MDRYIAIDNVCAWPNLTTLPDATIIAMIFNQPCHGQWEGDVECWASTDGGRLWQLRGTPAPHEPGTNRMNVAAGTAFNDDLIVLASGWSHRPPKEDGPSGFGGDARPLLPWVCRSADAGRTWARAETMPPPTDKSSRIIPFGDIVQLQDGALGVCIYSWQPPDEHNCYFYVSTDDGRTWSIRSVIQENNINETTPLVLPNGDVLACARTLDDQHLELFRSTDHGATWCREQALTGAKQHPAQLLNLDDGRILLSFGRRSPNPFFVGIGARLSDDGGRNWSAPFILHESRHTPDMEWPASDGGYPASVQLQDGGLLTAYYSSCVPEVHHRYHMGVVVWQLDADFDL